MMANLWLSHIPAATRGQHYQPLSHVILHQPCGATTAIPALQVQQVKNWSKEVAEAGSGPSRLTLEFVLLTMELPTSSVAVGRVQWTGQPCTFALGLGVSFSHDPVWP